VSGHVPPPSPSGLDPMIARGLDEVDPVSRAAFFRDLGLRQADSRPGVGLRGDVPDILWRRVPAGSFRMGGDRLAMGAWPGRSIDLAADYWMAAYPTTVAHYRAFVEDGGYTERWRACWTKEGWRWKGDARQPEYWNDGARRISNHPVEVTWYAAVAYTQWLEEQRRAGKLVLPGAIPDGHVIRLADEAEWERAARYPDGRFFPWGNEYRSGCANIDETSYYDKGGPYYLGQKTAVGIYRIGRHPDLDLYDLSGNVVEWCLTQWSEPGYSATNDREGIGYRVLRGGNWSSGQQFARAASRWWGDPDPDDQYDPAQGFRVVVGGPLRSLGSR
jgi:formylglycine-generating enzyme required for sulfatase activity